MSESARRPPGARVADAGLQSERTYLAWQRTGLSFAAIGVLLVHAAGGLRHPVADLPGLFGLAVGAAILLRALLYYSDMIAAARGERTAARPRLVAALAAATTVLGVTGLVIILFVP